jgi:hypothetical protein
MTSRIGIWMLLALLALTGCARHAAEKPASRLTEAERDTALARSSLPGASTVGRALDVSGQAQGRVAQEDSLARR